MTFAVLLSVLGLLQQYYAHGGSCGAADDKGAPDGASGPDPNPNPNPNLNPNPGPGPKPYPWP